MTETKTLAPNIAAFRDALVTSVQALALRHNVTPSEAAAVMSNFAAKTFRLFAEGPAAREVAEQFTKIADEVDAKLATGKTHDEIVVINLMEAIADKIGKTA